MSESRIIEIYECQVYSSFKKWYPYETLPYYYKQDNSPVAAAAAESELERCEVPYKINPPTSDWQWVAEWDIRKGAGETDEDGWEYASRMSRFAVANRASRTEPALWSKARRRLWTRVMRRDLNIKSFDTAKILQRTQAGLASIHAARLRIEEITRRAPESVSSPLMVNLVASVKKNIRDVIHGLDQLHSVLQLEIKNGKPSSSLAIVKKLRNDVLKEEQAIGKALTMQGSSASSKSNLESSTAAEIDAKVAGYVKHARVYGGSSKSAGATSGSRTISVELKEDLEQVNTYLQNADHSNGFSNNCNTAVSYNSNNNSSSNGSGKLSSSQKVAVKGGTRQSFDPTVFTSNADLKNGEPVSGVFMDRSRRDQRIFEKLIPVDEVTVMQGIIDERAVEIEKMNTGIRQVHEMFVDLSRLVKEQEIEINEIFQHAEESHEKSKAALGHIIQADQLQKQGQCCIS